MSFVHIFVLASIQGITEFLPVSSSGHLILVPAITGWTDQSLLVDVAVHVGTLAGVVMYFWRDVAAVGAGFMYLMIGKMTPNARLAYLLIIATVPLIIAGGLLWFTNSIEILRNIEIIAWATLGFGVLLYFSDRFFLTVRNLDSLTPIQALLIGLAQVLAFVPGTSRAGITITAARLFGFERKDSVRFAMLLSIPAITLPGVLVAIEVYGTGNSRLSQEVVFAGGLSFVFSVLTIALLMAWVRRSGFTPFAIYRVILGIAILVWIYLFDSATPITNIF